MIARLTCGLPGLALVMLVSVPATEAFQNGQSASAADKPRIVQLTVDAVPEASPALKHLLLPDFLDQKPGNAFALYDTAMELAADGYQNNSADAENIDAWVDMPLSELPREAVRELLGKHLYWPALHYLEMAARREYCHGDYPLREPGEAISLLLPNVSKLRMLARLQVVRVRLAIADGDLEQAVHDLQTGFAMARHTAEGPTLINSLVGIAIAALMTQQVEALVEAPGAPNLYWALTDLPRPLVDLRNVLGYERSMLHLAVPQLRDLDERRLTREEWEGLADELGRLPSLLGISSRGPKITGEGWDANVGLAVIAVKAYPQARRHLLSRGLSPEQIEAMPVRQMLYTYWLHEYAVWRDELFKWFSLPFYQAHERAGAAERRLHETEEFAYSPVSMLLPSLSRAAYLRAALDRQIALLRCIEAVRAYAATHDGRLPQTLDEVTAVPIPLDPTTGQSFGYSAEGDTFELTSPAPAGYAPRDGRAYQVKINR